MIKKNSYRRKIPEIVLDAAQKVWLCEMKYIGETDGAQVYGEVGKIDNDSFIIPRGLPCLIVLKDRKTEFIDGMDALKLLDRFD